MVRVSNGVTLGINDMHVVEGADIKVTPRKWGSRWESLSLWPKAMIIAVTVIPMRRPFLWVVLATSAK